MAIAPNQNILYDRNAPPLDLGNLKNNFKKIATCIPFAGDLLGLPIQAKLARLETDSSNIYHKREILRQSLDYDIFSLVRSYLTCFATPWLFSLAPASPLIMISLIGSSILLNNIFIFGDLERRFGKSSAMAKIAVFAFNCAVLCPQLRIFFLTKNILYLNGAVFLGKAAELATKSILFMIKEVDYKRVVSAIQNYESDLRYTLRRMLTDLDTQALDYLHSLGLNDVDSMTVFRFICRITDTADFRNVRNDIEDYGFDAVNQPIFLTYRYRIRTIEHNLRDFEEFRGRAIAEMADALEGCGDRIASALNALDILGYIYGAFKPTDDIDSAFLAIRLVRLDHVRQKAYKRNPGPEGLETQLFLEIELKDRLQLPLQTQNMAYAGIGRFGINRNILDQITQEILALTSTDEQVVDILTDSCVWKDRLNHHFADFYGDVMRGFEISARGNGLDYAKNLEDFNENPTDEWTEFLGQISPDHSQEVMQTLREICPSLSGQEYNYALTGPNGLIQQINRKKTIEWLTANGNALRARLNPSF